MAMEFILNELGRECRTDGGFVPGASILEDFLNLVVIFLYQFQGHALKAPQKIFRSFSRVSQFKVGISYS